MSVVTFAIKWKGVDLGEMSLPQIRRQLSDGSISRMHQISTAEGWMSVDEFMRRVEAAEAAEHQRRQQERRIESRPVVSARATSAAEPSMNGATDAAPVTTGAFTHAAYSGNGAHSAREAGSQEDITQVSSFFLQLLRGRRSTLWISFWMVIAAAMPFMISPLVQGFALGTDWVIWMLEGYFSLLIAGYVYKLSGAHTGLLKKGLGFFLFTIVIGIPILFQAQATWPFLKQIYAGTLKGGLGDGIIGYVLGVGVCEELCKALPLLIFCLGRGPLSVRDAVFLGMMSGLGFAFSEGAVYTFSSAADVVTINMGSTLQTLKEATSEKQFLAHLDKLRPDLVKLNLFAFVTLLVRLISVPLLHGAWTGCVGWFVARANVLKSWHSIAIGIAIMAVVHGIYDVIVSGFLGPGLASVILSLIILICSILLFASHLLARPAAPSAPAEDF